MGTNKKPNVSALKEEREPLALVYMCKKVMYLIYGKLMLTETGYKLLSAIPKKNLISTFISPSPETA